MARITWDNVVAPNYSSSMSGFANASNLLSGAFDSARAGLKDFDTTRRDRVNRVVAERMAKITSDEEMQAALKSGSLYQGINPELLSAESYRAAMARPSALLQNEYNRENNNQTAWENGITRLDDANSRKLAPHLTAFQKTMESGTPEEQAAAQSALMQAGSDLGMTADQVLSAARAGDGLIRTDREFRDSDQTFAENVYDFGVKREDREENRFVEATVGRLTEESLTVAEAAERLRGMTNVPDHLKARIARGLNIPGLLSVEDIAAFGSGGGGGGNNTDPYNTRFGHSRFTAPPKPLTQMTLGEVYDYGQNVLRPETRAAGFGKTKSGKIVGTSAVGAYQFVGGTLAKYAKEVLGPDWRNKTFTPEVQDKMAEALFNDTKNGNLKDTWEGLPQTKRGYYKDYTWEQMRDEIFRYEVGADPSAMYGASKGQAERARAVALTEQTGNPMVDGYFQNAGNKERVDQVAASLIKENPTFKGIPQADLEQLLRQVQTRANAIAKEYTPKDGSPARTRVNARQAGIILENSWGNNTWWNNFKNELGFGLPAREGWTIFDSGTAINDDELESNIRSVFNGGIESEADARDNVVEGAQVDAQLQAQVARLEAMAAAAEARGQVGRAADYRQQAEELKGVTVGERGNQTATGQGIGPGRGQSAYAGRPVVRTRLPQRPETEAEKRARLRREAARRREMERTRYPTGPKI